MPSKELNQKLQATHIKLKEMSIQMDTLDREYETLLEEVGISSDELDDYLSKPENFSEPIWESMQREKKKLDEKLDLSLKNIKDPNKIAKTLSEQKTIQPYWIYVR